MDTKVPENLKKVLTLENANLEKALDKLTQALSIYVLQETQRLKEDVKRIVDVVQTGSMD